MEENKSTKKRKFNQIMEEEEENKNKRKNIYSSNNDNDDFISIFYPTLSVVNKVKKEEKEKEKEYHPPFKNKKIDIKKKTIKKNIKEKGSNLKELREELLNDAVKRNNLLKEQKINNCTIKGTCWESTLEPSKQNGYIQVSYKGKKPFCIHVLSCYDNLERLPNKDEDISHLCHNSKCFNPRHLCIESKIYNQQRKNCKVWHTCPHCEHDKLVCICCHEPPCYKYDPQKRNYCNLEIKFI
jgi:hypothetical protein